MGNIKEEARVPCNPDSILTAKFKSSDIIIAIACPNDARFAEFFGNAKVHIVPIRHSISSSVSPLNFLPSLVTILSSSS